MENTAMRYFRVLFFCLAIAALPAVGFGKNIFDNDVRPADADPSKYCKLLTGKRIALIINHTSKVGDSSLLDILLARHINVVKIFVPEHGFRGGADAGAHVDNSVDSASGLSIVSLYGSHKKPTQEDLADVDIVVYDLQDVGARFYTYVSTLEYCLEACAAEKKKLIVLDRPNPNGFYVDGPVLEKQNRSFVGMQPVPVVYGMTAGEYARMLVGESMFPGAGFADLDVVVCSNYTHKKKYKLPLPPSPNLPNMAAVYAYPSVCFFEGTPLSVGRGTDRPFQQFGRPEFKGKMKHSFTPVSRPGAKKPVFENQECYGVLVGDEPVGVLKETDGKVQVKWLIAAYRASEQKEKFFTDFFTKLSGTKKLEEQIRAGLNEKDIRKSWQTDLKKFKKMRKKYLLYPDFE